MSGEVPVQIIPAEEARMLVAPDNWQFYTQPAGMKEEKDKDGSVIEYLPNENAENQKNMLKSYYSNLIRGKRNHG